MANKRTNKKNAKKEMTKANVSPVTTEEVKAETPAAPVVEAVKEATSVIEAAVPAETNETIEKKPAEEKAAAKAAPKKKAAPAKTEAAKKDDVFVIQSNGKEYSLADIQEACKAAYRNGTRKQVKSCDVYLKAENGGLRVYYVINSKADGAFIDL